MNVSCKRMGGYAFVRHKKIQMSGVCVLSREFLWNDLSEMKEPTKIIFWGEFCVKWIFLTKNGVKSELFYFTNKHTQK